MDNLGGIEGDRGLVVDETVGRDKSGGGNQGYKGVGGGLATERLELILGGWYVRRIQGGQLKRVPAQEGKEFVDKVDINLEADALFLWGCFGTEGQVAHDVGVGAMMAIQAAAMWA